MYLNMFPFYWKTIKFNFHPVWQGLFYSGKIWDWHFIYDCGTDSNISVLESAIASYKAFNYKKEVDFLILSHLHEDHFNGIPILIKSHKITNIILPFLSEEILLWLSIEYVLKVHSKRKVVNKNISQSDYIRFLSDPQEYFGRDVNIIYIRNEFINDNRNEKNDQDLTEWNTHSKWKNIKTTIELQNYLNESLWSICPDFYWNFHFHQKIIEKTMKDNLIIELKKLFPSIPKWWSMQEILDEILKQVSLPSWDKLKSLQDAYKKFFPNHNDESIILAHYPSKALVWYCKYDDINPHFILPKVQILTWDFPFRQKWSWETFLQFLKVEKIDKRDIWIFQVSHHGSRFDWNIGTLTDFDKSFPIISAWIINKHSHPGNIVLLDIKNDRRVWWWANEENDVQIRFWRIHFSKIN